MSADAALQAEELHQVDGRRLRVERAKVNRTLFVAKFSLSLLPAELRKLAESFGEVESVTIIKHHVTNKSKGCGFVKYRYREDAADAFTGMKAKNKKWVVEWATSANDPELLGVAKNLVYVGGLPFVRVTEAILRDHFSVYGQIEDVSIIHPNPHFLRRDAASDLAPLSPTSQASSSHTADSLSSSSARGIASQEPGSLISSTSAPTASNTTSQIENSSFSALSPVTAPIGSEQDLSSPHHAQAVSGALDLSGRTGDGKSDHQGLTASAASIGGAAGQPSEVSLARSASRGGSSNLGPSAASSVSPSTPNTSSTSESNPSSLASANVSSHQEPAASTVAEEATESSNLGISNPESSSTQAAQAHAELDLTSVSAAGDVAVGSSGSATTPLINGKPVTSYAFITFTEPYAAAAAIENEDGAMLWGEGPIRVQYCETPDMKLRKKLAKMRDAYPATGSPVVLGDPANAASYNAVYGHSVAHPHHASGLPSRHNAPTLVAGPNGSYVPHHPHHMLPSAHHRGHPAQVPQYAYFQTANPQGGYVSTGSGLVPSAGMSSSLGSSSGGMIGNLGVSALGAPSATGSAPAGYWSNAVGSNPNDPNGWYYVGPAAPLSINVPSKDLMLDLSGLSLDPTSPVAVPLGFPFAHSPTFAPLGFPPMSQLSPLTGPGMPYFPLPSYGLASSSGSTASSTTPSSPSSTHSNQSHLQGSNHYQHYHTTSMNSSTHHVNSNSNSASGSPSAGKASTSPTVSSANKAAKA